MKEKIVVLDNFLDKETFFYVKNNLLSDYFPWYKNDYKVNKEQQNLEENEHYNLQMAHSFYKDYRPDSNKIDAILPLLEKINPISFIRIKANLTFCTPKIITYGFHNDFYNKKITTAVFYINTNNGKTIFESGEEVESIENRLVLFNSTEKHSGTSTNDTKFRCLINLNFIEEE